MPFHSLTLMAATGSARRSVRKKSAPSFLGALGERRTDSLALRFAFGLGSLGGGRFGCFRLGGLSSGLSLGGFLAAALLRLLAALGLLVARIIRLHELDQREFRGVALALGA